MFLGTVTVVNLSGNDAKVFVNSHYKNDSTIIPPLIIENAQEKNKPPVSDKVLMKCRSAIFLRTEGDSYYSNYFCNKNEIDINIGGYKKVYNFDIPISVFPMRQPLYVYLMYDFIIVTSNYGVEVWHSHRAI